MTMKSYEVLDATEGSVRISARQRDRETKKDKAILRATEGRMAKAGVRS